MGVPSDISVAITAAVAENGVIGDRGRLPWRVSADLKRFRTITMGKPLIMGRKTYESIGRLLGGRDSVVVSRQPGLATPGAILVHDIAEAISVATERARARAASEIHVVGGGAVYRAMMHLADRLYISHICVRPPGDAFFPEILPADWIEISRESLPFSAGDTAKAVQAVYERRQSCESPMIPRD
jgi:dihydrofolate reductase